MVMVSLFRIFGRTFYIEEEMDDVTGDAETTVIIDHLSRESRPCRTTN